MDQNELVKLLNLKHKNLFDFLASHDDNDWYKGPIGKWRTSDHVLHLIQSLKPLNKALGIPKFLLRYKFGKSNRSVRNYDQVVAKYQSKLKQNPGVVSSLSRNMDYANSLSKQELQTELNEHKNKLVSKVLKWNDPQLETYILPHPLMGRMPIKEILLWTAYHTEHHHNILKHSY